MLPRCPFCDAPVDPVTMTMPFCSVRCKQLDLGRWLDERYTLPIERESDDDERPDLPRPNDDE